MPVSAPPIFFGSSASKGIWNLIWRAFGKNRRTLPRVSKLKILTPCNVTDFALAFLAIFTRSRHSSAIASVTCPPNYLSNIPRKLTGAFSIGACLVWQEKDPSGGSIFSGDFSRPPCFWIRPTNLSRACSSPNILAHSLSTCLTAYCTEQ